MENKLPTNKNYLICYDVLSFNFNTLLLNEYENVINNFCGNVIQNPDTLANFNIDEKTLIYICGDIEKIDRLINELNLQITVKISIIYDFSYFLFLTFNRNINSDKYKNINIDLIPITHNL